MHSLNWSLSSLSSSFPVTPSFSNGIARSLKKCIRYVSPRKAVAETFHISQLIKHVREQMRVRGDALGPPVSTRACILLEMS